MLWATWLTAAGSLLLTIGTGAQALGFKSDYNHLFGQAKEDARQALNLVEPQLTALAAAITDVVPIMGLGTLLGIIIRFPLIVGIPAKMADIREAGGDDAARLANLLRQSVAWTILMAGSALVLAALIIQLVITYAG